MQEKILKMLELQDAMNRKINESWREADYPWYRAIWTECAEMLDHYGWKWWKHQKPDIEQVKLEVVDIWHFTLSAQLMQGRSMEQTTEQIAGLLQQPGDALDLRTAIEEMAKDAIETHGANISIFASIMGFAGIGLNDLYRMYIGKNVLNFFRQDHGYQEGHYEKIWHGREDNEHLVDILATLNPDSDSFSEDIYQELKAAYPNP
ncbi:MAG: dUTP diphosphatase [Pseudomonadota bacterium]